MRRQLLYFKRSFFGSSKPQTYSISRVLNGSPQQLYKIVSEVNNYKDFVPFVEDSFVSSRDAQQQPTKAGLKVGWKDITEKFECSLACQENERVHARSLQLDLFHELETEWKFKTANGDKCRVDFTLLYRFKNPLYDRLSFIIDLESLYIDIDSELVENALERMVENVKRVKWTPYEYKPSSGLYDTYSLVTPPLVHVEIVDYNAELQLGVDESYDLNVSENGIAITSETVWGALHAFTTLQQLIIYKHGRYMLERSVHVQDYPHFRHRGIMIDAARNFLPVDSILEQIDIMSLVKMNVLHWHLVDSQSWPLILECCPEMSNDAYSKSERYTIKDLQRVQKYARERGVRVIPEIDMPGHARAGWKQVDPSLVKCGCKFWNGFAVEPPPGQLDVLNNKTYAVIRNVYNELSDVFTDAYFHVGNDELQKSCYPQEWFNNQTLSDITKGYLTSVLPIFNSVRGRKLIMWDDVLTSEAAVANIPKNITLQVWHEPSNIKTIISKGYDVVVSSADHLYLDCGYGGFLTNDFRYVDSPENDDFNTGQAGSWCGPYKTWQRIYSFDFLRNLTDTEKEKVLGAEAVLWSEQVDFTVLTGKLWPRSAALAESLWGGNKDEKGLKLYDMNAVETALRYVPQNEVHQLRVYRGILLVIRNLSPSLNVDYFPLVIVSFQRVWPMDVNEWVSKIRLVYWEILANFQRNQFVEQINILFGWSTVEFISPVIHFLFRQFYTEDIETTNENLLNLLKIKENHVLKTVHQLYLRVDFEKVDHDSKMLIHLLYDIITHESFAKWIDSQNEEEKITWLELGAVIVQTKDDWNAFELVGLLVWVESIFLSCSPKLTPETIHNEQLERILSNSLQICSELAKFKPTVQFFEHSSAFLPRLMDIKIQPTNSLSQT
ncbi:HEX1 [Candida theae]|uniref:beta-N-acetylhexosaminidase n=1 Tax=Candida theae TaxID=1198502 RepID=A0AAD5BGU0_9ASCO|nr:HEX1 [Candida theae]KAI5962038.1 HEX1 [Candida theae]